MDISYQDLKNRYAALSTDELLEIYVSSDLTETATELICMELNGRDVHLNQLRSATRSAEVHAALRADMQESIEKKLRIFAGALLVIALLAIGSVVWRQFA